MRRMLRYLGYLVGLILLVAKTRKKDDMYFTRDKDMYLCIGSP
jgi:hypothetical protein